MRFRGSRPARALLLIGLMTTAQTTYAQRPASQRFEAWVPRAAAGPTAGWLPDSLTRHRGTKPILKGVLIGSVVGVVLAAYANSLCRMDDSAGPHHCTRATVAAFAIPVAFGAFIGWLATLPPIPKSAPSQ